MRKCSIRLKKIALCGALSVCLLFSGCGGQNSISVSSSTSSDTEGSNSSGVNASIIELDGQWKKNELPLTVTKYSLKGDYNDKFGNSLFVSVTHGGFAYASICDVPDMAEFAKTARIVKLNTTTGQCELLQSYDSKEHDSSGMIINELATNEKYLYWVVCYAKGSWQIDRYEYATGQTITIRDSNDGHSPCLMCGENYVAWLERQGEKCVLTYQSEKGELKQIPLISNALYPRVPISDDKACVPVMKDGVVQFFVVDMKSGSTMYRKTESKKIAPFDYNSSYTVWSEDFGQKPVYFMDNKTQNIYKINKGEENIFSLHVLDDYIVINAEVEGGKKLVAYHPTDKIMSTILEAKAIVEVKCFPNTLQGTVVTSDVSERFEVTKK